MHKTFNTGPDQHATFPASGQPAYQHIVICGACNMQLTFTAQSFTCKGQSQLTALQLWPPAQRCPAACLRASQPCLQRRCPAWHARPLTAAPLCQPPPAHACGHSWTERQAHESFPGRGRFCQRHVNNMGHASSPVGQQGCAASQPTPCQRAARCAHAPQRTAMQPSRCPPRRPEAKEPDQALRCGGRAAAPAGAAAPRRGR